MDFDWPLNQPWEGFINPHYEQCPDCEAGYSDAYELVAKALRGLMWDHKISTHPVAGKITEYLAGRPGDSPFGHDSVDHWSAVKKLAELAGLPEGWDRCTTCGGHGIHPDVVEDCEEWEPTEPPRRTGGGMGQGNRSRRR